MEDVAYAQDAVTAGSLDLDFECLVEQLVKAHRQEVHLLRESLSKAVSCAQLSNGEASPQARKDAAKLKQVQDELTLIHERSDTDGMRQQLICTVETLKLHNEAPGGQENVTGSDKMESAAESAEGAHVNFAEAVQTIVFASQRSSTAGTAVALQPRDSRRAETSEFASEIEPSADSGKLQRMKTDLRPVKRLKLGNIDLDVSEPDAWWCKILHGSLDAITSCLIMLNAILLAVQLELNGHMIAADLENGELPPYQGALKVCSGIDNFITVCFLLELVLRISVSRSGFFWSWTMKKFKAFNMFDTAIVACTCVDLCMASFMNSAQNNIAYIRLVRLLRMMRMLRLTRMLGHFGPFRVLVTTVLRSFMALFWAMVLLFFMMFIAAVALCQTLQPVIQDRPEAMSESDRQELFNLYGTFGKAIQTMFKMTFSGCWPSYANKVLEVHPAYSIFFVGYVSIVIFACTRIITALFLRDTLKAAESDADMMVAETLEKKRKYLRKLHDLFCIVDVSGDGHITIQEFEDVICRPQVRAYLELLDIQVQEVEHLFHLLEGGSGFIEYYDFLQGILKLKGQARAMDIVTLTRETHKVLNVCTRIEQLCQKQALFGTIEAL